MREGLPIALIPVQDREHHEQGRNEQHDLIVSTYTIEGLRSEGMLCEISIEVDQDFQVGNQ